MGEPKQFRRGKDFQKLVRKTWEEPRKPAEFHCRFEEEVTHKKVRGRADIVLYVDCGFRAVLEI